MTFSLTIDTKILKVVEKISSANDIVLVYPQVILSYHLKII